MYLISPGQFEYSNLETITTLSYPEFGVQKKPARLWQV